MEPHDVVLSATAYEPRDAMLNFEGVTTGYGAKRVLADVSFHVGRGEAVALLGHNGAGKTTALKTVLGLQKPWEGTVSIDGAPVGAAHAPREAVGQGVAMIPSERFVFPDLTVHDNLRIAAQGLPAAQIRERIDSALDDYPILRERLHQRAGTMSGGQQRMVSLAMALMRRPRLLLLDEPSLGLSPAVAQEVMQRVTLHVASGMSVLLVEQNVPLALSLASRIYVARSGRIIREMTAEALRGMGPERWWELF